MFRRRKWLMCRFPFTRATRSPWFSAHFLGSYPPPLLSLSAFFLLVVGTRVISRHAKGRLFSGSSPPRQNRPHIVPNPLNTHPLHQQISTKHIFSVPVILLRQNVYFRPSSLDARFQGTLCSPRDEPRFSAHRTLVLMTCVENAIRSACRSQRKSCQ